jgi:sensor histidine kinase YesM
MTMKTEMKDLYLPKRISLHVKYLLFCAIFTPIWGLIIKAPLNSIFLTCTFLMMFLDIEILGFLSKKIFKFGGTHTRKEITKIFLTRLVFFLIVTLAVVLLTYILFTIILTLIKGWSFPGLPGMVNSLKYVTKVTAIALLFSTAIFFFSAWQESMKRVFELKEKNLIFQNETLKNQVNPHFLFNSLNTLSSLINAQTEIAEYFVGKLSSIYRYILENGSKDRISLKAELAFIEDYFYLHQIRSEGKIRLSIEVKDDQNYEILPVSLQLLIENAIKHNMATIEKPLQISIYIEGKNVVVKNNLQKMATQVVSTKIGLKNLSERIRLNTGKEIIIEETAKEFIVKVPLSS